MLGKAPRRAARGFTLIELVVALSAGLLVAMAALALSRSATRFFQHEARISAAQLAASLGMSRITADLERAAFLGTFSNKVDPHLCTQNVILPPSLANLTGIQIRRGGSVIDHGAELSQSVDPENAMNPDSIVLSGSFDTVERFTSRSCMNGGPNDICLLPDGTINRLRNLAAAQGKTLADALSPIFRPGRFLRIEDPSKTSQNRFYGIIQNLSVSGPAMNENIQITLTTAPALPFRTSTTGKTSCGLRMSLVGQTVSVLSRVRYDLRSLKGTMYNSLVHVDPNTDVITGEDNRTELVRVELDDSGAEIPETLELVAELAVDLKFGVSKTSALNAPNPTMTSFPFDHAEVETTPELIRAVDVRLSTRARVPDRDTPLISDGRPYHFAALPSSSKVKTRFARMRTLHAHVVLPNQDR